MKITSFINSPWNAAYSVLKVHLMIFVAENSANLINKKKPQKNKEMHNK